MQGYEARGSTRANRMERMERSGCAADADRASHPGAAP